MNFIVDENLSRRLARELRTCGHAAWHCVELLGASPDDRAIWDEAIRRGAVIVSKDADFVPRLSGPPPHAAVVWLRAGNCSTQEVLERLLAELPRVVIAVEAGELLIEP